MSRWEAVVKTLLDVSMAIELRSGAPMVTSFPETVTHASNDPVNVEMLRVNFRLNHG